MSANPSALLRLWSEFSAVEPDVLFGGIYANKSGYHNTRANHLRDRPNDYSIQAAADRRGPSDKAAAIDLTFKTAQRSDFHVIAKYTRRLIEAMQARDPRLFYKNEAVVRECFGNADSDREVEGWSLYRGYAVSSDSSHLWHIHISFHRAFVENWDAVSGVLNVLLDRDGEDGGVSKQDVIDAFNTSFVPNKNNPGGETKGKMSPAGALSNLEATQDQMNGTLNRLFEREQARYDALLGNIQQNDRYLNEVNRKVSALSTAISALADALGGAVSEAVRGALKDSVVEVNVNVTKREETE